MLPSWIAGDGPDADIVVSSRARLARNLAALPFPARASREQLKRVADLVTSAARRLEGLGHDISVVRVDDLSDGDKNNLVNAHVMSPEHLQGGADRLMVLEPAGRIAIMVNEEDHLRIQSILSGLRPEEVWQCVDDIDEELGRHLEFAYSGRYGYLTASVTNAGTGLRISALMHLGGLALLGKLKKTLKAAYELGVSVRGLFGEGTAGLGDFYQVSNEVTLGLEEREIVDRVRGVANYLLAEERGARSLLAEEQHARLGVRATECVKALASSRSVSAGDALRLLSPIRVACSAGAASGIDFRTLNEMLAAIKLRHKTEGEISSFDLAKSDVERASLLREKLKTVIVSAVEPRMV